MIFIGLFQRAHPRFIPNPILFLLCNTKGDCPGRSIYSDEEMGKIHHKSIYVYIYIIFWSNMMPSCKEEEKFCHIRWKSHLSWFISHSDIVHQCRMMAGISLAGLQNLMWLEFLSIFFFFSSQNVFFFSLMSKTHSVFNAKHCIYLFKIIIIFNFIFLFYFKLILTRKKKHQFFCQLFFFFLLFFSSFIVDWILWCSNVGDSWHQCCSTQEPS